jgi:hypothetical protein
MSETKRCSRCGTAFGCGRQDPHCWCSELPPLPASALDGAIDCYCPACLAALAERHAEPGPASRETPRDA